MLRTVTACLTALSIGLALGASVADDVRTDRGDNARETPLYEPNVRLAFTGETSPANLPGAPVVMRPVLEGPSVEETLSQRAFSPQDLQPQIEPAAPPPAASDPALEEHVPLAPTLPPDQPAAIEPPAPLPTHATATMVPQALIQQASAVLKAISQPTPSEPAPEAAELATAEAAVGSMSVRPEAPPEPLPVAEAAPEAIESATPEVILIQPEAPAAVSTATGPAIAIVIDDLGFSDAAAQRVVALSVPVTVSILPYGRNLDGIAQAARAKGHGVLLHLPMEPDGSEDPGPKPLLTSMTDDQLRTRVEWNFTQFEDFDGVNNHMGSRFTRNPRALRTVFDEIARRGLFFLDSFTSPSSVGVSLAQSMGLPVLKRDIFLDDAQTVSHVAERLAALEGVARTQGYGIAIGHPHDVTLDVLERWIPHAQSRGLRFVTTKELLRQLNSEQLASLPAPGG